MNLDSLSKDERRRIHVDSIFFNKFSTTNNTNLNEWIEEQFGRKISLDRRKELWSSQETSEEEIDTKNIVPSQDIVFTSILKNILNNKYNTKDKILGLLFESKKVLLFDGHHRIASSILQGRKTEKVKLIHIVTDKLFIDC